MEEFHDLVAVDDGLQQAFVVLLLQVGEFLTHHTEILEEHLFLHLVLAGDIGLAEQHQIVDVVAGIVQQTAYGTVRHLAVGNDLWPHVQVDELLYIAHLVAHRQLQAPEQWGHHLGTDGIVVVEGPPHPRLPSLRLRLPDVVQQGGPAEPEC